jgi:iron complex outermembrane receptor protein
VITLGALNADGRTQNRRATWGTGDSDGDTVDTRLQGKFETGALAHTLLVGADWQKADWQGERGAMVNPLPIDIFEPVYSNYVPVTRTIGLTRGINRQSGLYLQDQIAENNWRFTLGGLYDWTKDDTSSATYTVATGLTGPVTRNQLKNEAFTARAGVLYLFESGFNPYLSYAESFQPSTTSVLQSYTRTPFDPITGTQWEAGLKFQPASFDGLITLSAYDLRQQNIVTQDPDQSHRNCGSSGGDLCSVQDGEGRIRGIELEGRITPIDGLSIIGAATRMDSEMTRSDLYLGKELAMVPDYSASLWADYTLHDGALSGLSIAAGVRYNGESYGDSANLYRIPSYSLFDAALRYRFEKVAGADMQLSLNVSNLTDKLYVSTCSGVSSCYYGTGRTITASLQVGW